MEAISKTELMELLQKKGLKAEDLYKTQIRVWVNKDNLINHLVYLQSIDFDHLANITGVDYIDENEFEVVYHTYSYTHKIHILNKTRINRDNPVLPSIVKLWEQAQFYEQEVHEFFGIVFEGNKDLSPLFLQNWLDLTPLRKDFNTKEYSIKAYGAKENGGGTSGR